MNAKTRALLFLGCLSLVLVSLERRQQRASVLGVLTPPVTPPITIRGDLNGDGKVDGLDFAYWKVQFVKGLMTGSEFAVWKAAFLSGVLPTPAVTATATASPRPSATSTPTVLTGCPAGKTVAFEDNFNGTKLDTTKWNYCIKESVVNGQFLNWTCRQETELAYYKNENVVVANGSVNLIAKKEPFSYTE